MKDVNTMSLPRMFEALGGPLAARAVAVVARDEDLGVGGKPGDVTSLVTIGARETCVAHVRARQSGVVSGLAAVPELVRVFGPRVKVVIGKGVRDGAAFRPGQTLLTLRGPTREVLGLERTLLNLLCRLSGVAMATAAYRAAMVSKGTVKAQLFDTRKTTPGLRVLEKYAVRCGGGRCHRIGLFDAVLIKDNHIAAVPLGELTRWVEAARKRADGLKSAIQFFEVEVDALEQLERVLAARSGKKPAVDIVLLDNMPPPVLKKAVAMRDRLAPGVELEASGGVNLKTIAAIAKSGVDRISVGALTHSAPIVDLGLDFEGEKR
ncbi:MAG TPA: carboxylating nicotinate-nucleotide diphosphorylase [Phycisphaerales bacterium]